MKVYADNAATTQISDHVLLKILPMMKTTYANPSSIHQQGREAKALIEKSRKQVADAICCKCNDIYFTSGGTEANNWAIIKAASLQWKKGKNHIITSSFEHHAVLHTMKYLESLGYNVTYVKSNNKGLIELSDIQNNVRPETGLVSIMYVNNEIGTIQPISQIGEFCNRNHIIFHTDAVQAIGNIQIDVKEQNIDLLTMSGHKFYAPKGVGALYVSDEVKLDSLLHGGSQENGKRAGTENVIGIVGIGEAIQDIYKVSESKNIRIRNFRDRLLEMIAQIPDWFINGDLENNSPNILNVGFKGVGGESLLLLLDNEGIAVSAGSACTAGSLEPSHVLKAIGLSDDDAHSSIRISLGIHNTEDEVDYIAEKLIWAVDRLRQYSSVYEAAI